MSQSELESLASVSEDYIDDVEGLRAFVRKAEDLGHFGACSIDTEADSMHSYETKLCLIQFSIPGALAIFDPLAIGIDALREFTLFVDRFEIVWMHGADYDISLFNSTFNWVPRKIYDTQVGARFLGKEKFGLANLLEDEYGIKLSKQSQKADWSRRPLNEKMLAYAFNDVRYLLDLGGKYLDRLAEAERLGAPFGHDLDRHAGLWRAVSPHKVPCCVAPENRKMKCGVSLGGENFPRKVSTF